MQLVQMCAAPRPDKVSCIAGTVATEEGASSWGDKVADRWRKRGGRSAAQALLKRCKCRASTAFRPAAAVAIAPKTLTMAPSCNPPAKLYGERQEEEREGASPVPDARHEALSCLSDLALQEPNLALDPRRCNLSEQTAARCYATPVLRASHDEHQGGGRRVHDFVPVIWSNRPSSAGPDERSHGS